ncbi:hypothetical protein ACGFIK_02765 [Micromonospora sp. NPDC048871]|uniref:hypothetical protein n=1 Tax=unclassified Micromonospora TaxID=2617518 RepID=UPI00370FBE1D|nr:hypothetical protein OIE53_16555 [Micromonospora sp. NBC_01739]
MRLVHRLAGMLLLAVGMTALIGAAALGLLTGRADPGGGYAARFETVQTDGHAVVVTDLAALVREEVPLVHLGETRMRLEAHTPEGPAFIGLAPVGEVRHWLAPAPYAVVERMALTRGPLPVRLAQVIPPDGQLASLPTAPAAQTFWTRTGAGTLEWTPEELSGLSLVLMGVDGRADLTLQLRAELRPGWLAPATWGSLTAGTLLVTVAGVLLLRPLHPREVVFVVEPDQVPVLAGRLGISSLTGLGTPTPRQPLAIAPTHPPH